MGCCSSQRRPVMASAPPSKQPAATAKPTMATAKGITKPAPSLATEAKAAVNTAAQKRDIAAFLAGIRNLFVDSIPVDVVSNPEAEQKRYDKLVRAVILKNYIISGLALLLIVLIPLAEPMFQYMTCADNQCGSQTGDHPSRVMVPLTMPNMTNNAVLSWASASITEIMTFGFGDFNPKLVKQSKRFTADGWKAFVEAFLNQKIGATFEKNRLVLTTVPSDTPIIVSQGPNQDNIYQWVIQMPVIMTYATNDNITQHQKTTIELTIVRVPAEYSPAGIAIDTYAVARN
jgi:intracellular multiplication protein IcmL